MSAKITFFLPYMSNEYNYFKMKEISFLSTICTSLKINNIKFQVINLNENDNNDCILNNIITLVKILKNKNDILISYLDGKENLYLKEILNKIAQTLKLLNLSKDYFLYYQPTFDDDVYIYLCVMKELKSFLSDLKIICCGLYFSQNSIQSMKQYSFIDYIIDYPPGIITDVIKSIDNEKIKSISYRSRGLIKKNPRGVINFNSYVMPDHYLLTKKLTIVPILYCIGCLYKCFFCDYLFAGQKLQLRNIDSLLEEIVYYYKNGIRYYWIEGSAINLELNHLVKFCKAIIKNNLKIKWSAPIIPLKIDKPTFNIMNRAGCMHLRIGIETTNGYILKKFKKGVNQQTITATLRDSSEANIKNTLAFIIGLPFEKKSDNIKKIFFIKRNIKYIYSIRTFIFELRRNTRILKHPYEFNLEPIEDTSNSRYLKFNKIGGQPWKEIVNEQLFMQK